MNYQFGWRPFIKDILDFVQAQKKLESHIRFARKNNGKWIKRNGTLRDEVTTTTSEITGYITPVLVSNLCWPPGSLDKGTKTVVTTDKIWFEAMMKYYIAELEVDSCQSIWTSPLLRKLYGLDISPSLLYQVMPWTWLQDWFINIGDIVSNMSDTLMFDNLVAKYAYVMRHRSMTVMYDSVKPLRSREPNCTNGRITSWNTARPGPRPRARVKFLAECKERAQASQWGFGNEGESLTDRQLAILLALGISKT